MAHKLQQQEDIFHAARTMPAEQRQAYLQEVCAGDPDLLGRMEALLAADVSGLGIAAGAEASLLGERPGAIIDRRYKLLEQIGEGGFGVVFMAEQTRPVKRRVALKILKPGMDTRQVIARFEAERQALALMDHPNIARVLDAGATEAGRPYFVMELVHGTPITAYCDENKLAPAQRLGLFVAVCRAVQHAHQKGIIHRDIKPTNVLVTLHDGVPVPKVIDFGIAKAMGQQELTDKTLFTAFAQMVGTPLYMSPEQAEMSGLDIDTRSDIYSLGVLLYELLTGTTPFDKERLKKAAYEEIRRIIREEEPPSPSTRISTLGPIATTVSERRRQSDAARLSHLVRGELDWIVMRAMEKDRTRRYETASGLARDVERYLADEAVEACPPSRLYRAKKLIRRHRGTLTMAAIIAAVLLAATGVSVREAVRARLAERQIAGERDRAQEEGRRADQQAAIAEAVNGFFNDDVLRQASPINQSQTSQPPDRNLTVREALDRAAAHVGVQFRDKPLVEARIRYSLGDAYGDLMETAKAEENLLAAERLYRTHLGDKANETLGCVWRLSILYTESEQRQKNQTLWEHELERRRKAFGETGRDTLAAMDRLAESYQSLKAFDKALPLRLKVVELSRQAFGPRDPQTATSINNLGVLYDSLNQSDKAEQMFEQALAIDRDSHDKDVNLSQEMMNLAHHYSARSEYSRAESLLTEALQRRRELDGQQAPETLDAMSQLAGLHESQMHYAQAARLYAQVADTRSRVLGEDHYATIIASADAASCLLEEGQYAAAQTLLLRVADWSAGHPTSELASAGSDVYFTRLIAAYRFAGQAEKARPWEVKLRGWLEAKASSPVDPAADVRVASEDWIRRASCYARLGDFRRASEAATKATNRSQHGRYWAAALRLYLADEAGYHQMQHAMLYGGAGARSAAPAADTCVAVAETSLAGTVTVADAQLALQFLDSGSNGRGARSAVPMRASLLPLSATTRPYSRLIRDEQVQLISGMGEYRRGNPEAAIRWLQDCRNGIGRQEALGKAYSLEMRPYECWGATASFFLALAEHQLGHEDKAAAALADGQNRLAQKVEAPDSLRPNVGTPDWLVAHAAAREAEHTLGGDRARVAGH